MNQIPLVLTQFSPPSVREHFVQRSQLNKKLKGISKHPLSIVYAGAGYGKSTALSLYSTSEKSVCWFTVSKNDDDLLPFLNKAIYAIKQKYPSFGNSIQGKNPMDGFLTSEKIISFAAQFINEAMELKEKIILVLDDFHHAQSSKEIQQWILFILEHLPNNLQIVLSTRIRPQWDLLASFSVKGDLYEITQEDLTLQPDEMVYMIEDFYGLELSEEDVKNIFHLTEGWAIAFHLLLLQLKDGSSLDKLFESRQKSLKDLFDYLAAEVFLKQPPLYRNFLLQSSVLDILDPHVYDEMAGTDGSTSILADLAEKNVFIAEGEGGVYRYHALFKVFLENRLLKSHRAKFVQLHARAADLFNAKGDIETALFHYKKIKDYDAVSNLLSGHGQNLLRSGRLQSLNDILKEIPDDCKKDVPILYFYAGEIERYRSNYEKAEAFYDRIISIIPEYDAEHYYLLGLAFVGKARIYLDTIQPGKAERFVKQAIDLHEKAEAPKKEMAKLYEFMAENLLNFGEAGKALSWFERARSLDLPLEESNLQARIFLRTGKLEMAKEVLLKRKERHSNKSEKHLPQAHRETDILLSLIEAMMGNTEESKRLAQEGIQLGLAVQSPFVEACGWMRLGHAVQLLPQYDAALANQCYETSLEIMGKIGISRGKAEPYMGLAVLFGMAKKFEQAKEFALKGLAETEKVNDRWLSAFIKISFGLASVFSEKWQDARGIFEEVVHDMERCGDPYGVMVSSFWCAFIALKQKKEDVYKRFMRMFLTKMEQQRYHFFLEKRTMFGPRDMQMAVSMLIKAKEQKICPGYTDQLLRELGIDGNIVHHPGYTLTVQTLGEFVVRLGCHGEEIRDWPREKAKELLALFITRRSEMLMKEAIFQWLWPGEDPDSAGRKFKVALNTLLKVLEPARKAREESFFIIRKGSSYGFNPRAAIEMDIELFQLWLGKGLEEKEPKRAKEWLEKGLRMYRGEFLADMRFAAWCTEERERLQLLYLRGAEKAAYIHAEQLDFHQCMEWCEKILQLDNTWEEAYRLIMYSYHQKNNRPQALKWYEKCRAVLEKELGVDPTPSTKTLYQKIIGYEQV